MQILKESDLARLWKQPKGGTYIFFGAEDYLKAHYVKMARTALQIDEGLACFNDITVDVPDYSPSSLEDILSTPPMLCDCKLVVLRSFRFDTLKAADLDALLAVLRNHKDDESNLLIISVVADAIDEGYLPKRPSALLGKLSETATLVHFEEPSPAKLAVWVARHLESDGVTVSRENAAFVIEYCGKSMVALLPETGKLAAYVLAHGRKEVTREDILHVCAPSDDLESFALSTALLSGDRRKMLGVLEIMKTKRVKPDTIMPEIARTMGDLLLCKMMLAEHTPLADIAAALTKGNTYRAGLYVTAAKARSMEKLQSDALRAAEADLAMKSYGKRGYEEIEKWICFS